MSRQIEFYGSSDDLFEIDGSRGSEPDEIGCFDRPAAVRVSTEREGLVVVANYAPISGLGCWTIGISPIDEDIPLPSWPMTWRTEGYSTLLTLEAPDDALIVDLTDAQKAMEGQS